MTTHLKPWENTNAFTGDTQQFTRDNWNDPFINLFREAFAPAEHTETPITVGLLTVRHEWHNDQNYYFIEDVDELLYVMSFYKHRGRTEAFYEADTGDPVTLHVAKDLYKQMTDPNYLA
ncbi:hypothetical protein [Schaalia turicensis]|uniref:hypothetical protein n=1 Tax=Schaalia turicensis TaxID=131111 RepID=UPI0034A47CB0